MYINVHGHLLKLSILSQGPEFILIVCKQLAKANRLLTVLF